MIFIKEAFLSLQLMGALGSPLLDRTFDPEVLLFTAELDHFIELSSAHHAREAKDQKSFDELSANANRIAEYYFTKILKQSNTHESVNQYLERQIKQNTQLKNYFILLGNAFSTRASLLLADYHKRQSRIKLITAGSAALIGAFVGGTYLWIRVRSLQRAATTSGLQLVDYTVAAGLLAGATTIGITLGKSRALRLPVNPQIRTAQDFYLRYPTGEDFVEKLGRESQDLKLLKEIIREPIQ